MTDTELLTRTLPGAILALSVIAALIYFAAGDWRRGLYWTAAAVITATVTF